MEIKGKSWPYISATEKQRYSIELARKHKMKTGSIISGYEKQTRDVMGPNSIKVYCDRLAIVEPSQDVHAEPSKNTYGTFKCPKCSGICKPAGENIELKDVTFWNCMSCGRGWEKVPKDTTSEKEAEQYVLNMSFEGEKTPIEGENRV